MSLEVSDNEDGMEGFVTEEEHHELSVECAAWEDATAKLYLALHRAVAGRPASEVDPEIRAALRVGASVLRASLPRWPGNVIAYDPERPWLREAGALADLAVPPARAHLLAEKGGVLRMAGHVYQAEALTPLAGRWLVVHYDPAAPEDGLDVSDPWNERLPGGRHFCHAPRVEWEPALRINPIHPQEVT